jgi:hypothetical protein
MHKSQAFWAGVTGALVMTIIMALARFGGMDFNLEMILGTWFGLDPGVGTWLFGLVVHLAIGGVIGLIYGAGFEYWLHRSRWSTGVGLSVIHLVIAGIIIGGLPAVHPLIPEVLMAPGPFLVNFGLSGVVAFIALHLIYGGIVGSMYEVSYVAASQPAGKPLPSDTKSDIDRVA